LELMNSSSHRSLKKPPLLSVRNLREIPGADLLLGKIDYLLMTAGGGSSIHWNQLFSFLAPRGKIILIGFTGREPIPCPPLSLIMGEKGIIGSAAGSRNVTIQMLKFAAAHQILPTIEMFPASEVNVAFTKIKENSIRYRAVLQMENL
jgi:D-arabinose 1-dehydrogenase-like Zn-dependent alcohol dehydrogenase